jgi:hypothetical protein
MLRIRSRQAITASLFTITVLTGCSSTNVEVPSPTVGTLPTSTSSGGAVDGTTSVNTETAPIETTVADSATTTSTTTSTIPPATVAAANPAVSTIYSTPLVLKAPGLDTYPTVTGDYTDQDFARIVAGRYREYWTQAETLKPDLDRLLIWETDNRAKQSLAQIAGAAKDGHQYRGGSIDDFVVTNVDRDPESVIVTICSRQNAAEWDLGKTPSTADDKLIDDGIGILRAQFALVKRGSEWKIDGVLDLAEGPCDAVFG